MPFLPINCSKKYSSRITHGFHVEAAWAATRSTLWQINTVGLLQDCYRNRAQNPHRYTTWSGTGNLMPSTQDKAIVEQRRLKKIERLEKQLSSLKNASYN